MLSSKVIQNLGLVLEHVGLVRSVDKEALADDGRLLDAQQVRIPIVATGAGVVKLGQRSVDGHSGGGGRILRELGGKMSGAASCPCCESKACAKRRLAKMGEMMRSRAGSLLVFVFGFNIGKWHAVEPAGFGSSIRYQRARSRRQVHDLGIWGPIRSVGGSIQVEVGVEAEASNLKEI